MTRRSPHPARRRRRPSLAVLLARVHRHGRRGASAPAPAAAVGRRRRGRVGRRAGGDCPTAQPDPLPAGETRTVTIETDLGDIVIEVEADLSPIAAGNFVALASCGYYDGVVFHRVVPGFVIQGGDGEYGAYRRRPARRDRRPGYTIKDEPVTGDLRPRHRRDGPDSDQPNSVGSQFFIVLDDAAATRWPRTTPTRSSAR